MWQDEIEDKKLYVLSRSADQPKDPRENRSYAYESVELKNMFSGGDDCSEQSFYKADHLSKAAFCLYKHIFLLRDLRKENVGMRTTTHNGHNARKKVNLAIIDSAAYMFPVKGPINDKVLKSVADGKGFSRRDVVESALAKVIFHPKSGMNVIQEYDKAIIYQFKKLHEFELFGCEEKTVKVSANYAGYGFDKILEKREIFITRAKKVLAEIKVEIPSLYKGGDLNQKQKQLKKAEDNLNHYLNNYNLKQEVEKLTTTKQKWLIGSSLIAIIGGR